MAAQLYNSMDAKFLKLFPSAGHLGIFYLLLLKVTL